MSIASRNRTIRAIVLLECMLAVFIFGLAALGLGRCVQNCMRAERFRREEALAQRALANYWIQIELGALPLAADQASIELDGAWTGMKLAVTREPLTLHNEKDQELFGLYQVKLALAWGSGPDQQVRTMDFILYPRTR
jgi:hypothetical protein